MFKRLRCKRGVFNLVAMEIILASVAFVLAGTALTVPQIKDPFRARKAVNLCYCMEEGATEAYCKSDAAIGQTDIQEGITLEICKGQVASMSKGEIIKYIKDDIVLVQEKNLGFVN